MRNFPISAPIRDFAGWSAYPTPYRRAHHSRHRSFSRMDSMRRASDSGSGARQALLSRMPEAADDRHQVVEAAVARVVENITTSLRAMVPEHAIRRLIELEVRAAMQALPPVTTVQASPPRMSQIHPGPQPSSAPATDRIAYRVNEAAAAIGISKTKLWELIAQDALPARKLDGVRLIRRVDLEAFIDTLPASREGRADG